MNLPLLPTFGFVESPAPSLSPLAAYAVSENSVRLGLAGSGSIEVTRAGITVLAPDSPSYQRTIDRLGDWARAQWLAAQGFRVMRGAAVARQGKAIALVGGSRCGASVLALVLSRRGWGLISDGLIVVDAQGFLRSMEPTVTLDAEATVGLPADVPISRLTTGRERVAVTTAGHPDTAIGAYAILRVQQSLTHLAFEQVDFTDATVQALEGYRVPSLLRPATSPPDIVAAPAWRIARPVASLHPHEYSPPALAELLMRALDSEEG